ncbi:glycogen debranching N-terminal domain-containing protein [Plantactinospora sp. B6F1]|uniref:amylo-alpha-1,6-glucosidase n=1 Tax=Plantactinospora sp. B6F1 TaxID=3158971 RepID=UPI0032D99B50
MKHRISVLDGNTFVVSNSNGDIAASHASPEGFFSFDTRFLSTWVLTVDGQGLNGLAVDDLNYFEAKFFCVPGEPTPYVNATLSVIRHRWVGGSFDERLTIVNHAQEAVDLLVRLEVASDFADVFDVKNAVVKQFKPTIIVADGALHLDYRREDFHRTAIVRSTEPSETDERGMSFRIRVEPQASWSTLLRVESVVRGMGGSDVRSSIYAEHKKASAELAEDLRRWFDSAPRLETDSLALAETYAKSVEDLAALRHVGMSRPTRMPSAGLPWFMAPFGRDNAITCLQTLPFTPELTPTMLNAFAAGQGARLGDFREEEPGKIAHETRYGESSSFEEQPHSPYYGSADATPLFVILLDEYERWSGDSTLARHLELEARAALDWIDTYANIMGDGYIWYQRRNEATGLENQCWKDSWDAISYRDGRLPGFPRATCELQGYAYDAKLRGARLARLFWHDEAYAQRLEREAADLKARFNRDFWIADGEYYALALDPDGEPVDALSSNIGHLLWSGIVEESRAAMVVDHLMGPRLFSGWGVRTLAEGEGRYNPVGYHVGTVWPFDNSITAWGMWRYGFRSEAGRIAQAIIDAAPFFDGRLPEVFAGYSRQSTRRPVGYPTASSPQAWSTGAPPLLLRIMLGMQPHGEELLADPALPAGIQKINLFGVLGRWGRQDVSAERAAGD